MERLYHLWIRIKYQYYKLYWKIWPPKPQHKEGFYGWTEIGFIILNKRGIACGTIPKQDSQ